MTQTTRDGTPISKEQFVALYIFHGIFGFHYKPISEEANNLDRDLLEDPDFMKDIFTAVDNLPYPCGEVMLRRMWGHSFKEIAKSLKIRVVMAQEHDHTAWRLIRRPERTKSLRRYTEGFEKWEEELEKAYEEETHSR